MELRWKGTKADLLASLRRLPAVLSGREPDPLGLGAILQGFVGNAALARIRADFLAKSAGGVGSDGVRWPALAESTLERRRRKGLTHEDILVEYGSLLASLTAGTGEKPSGAADQVFRLEADGVTVGTAERKADIHQKGTGRIPARPITPDDLPPGWTPDIEAAAERAMEMILERVCDAGGLP